jgi:uncharacterized membrane protein YuzA (DUF378 family)
MNQSSEVSAFPTLSRTPDLLVEPSEELRNGALAQARQLRLHFSASWDPYEVWYTRVRSEGEREAALRTPVERIATHRAQGGSFGLARRRMSSMPLLAWPALLSALALGLNRELVGIFRLDLVGLVFGNMTPAARVVQVLFGISAICAVVMALRLAGYRLMPPW